MTNRFFNIHIYNLSTELSKCIFIISYSSRDFNHILLTCSLSSIAFFFVYCSQNNWERKCDFEDLTKHDFQVTIQHLRKKKSPWDGSSLPCSQRLSTTWLDHAVSVLHDHIFRSAAFGLTTFVFSLSVFSLRLPPPTWFFDRFLGDHLCFLEVRVLTTFLTIVRSGLHGNSSTREHENVRFGWQNSTKKH